MNPSGHGPLEFAIEPGQTITLTVKIERHGYNGQVPFGTEGAGRNLPFGVIVDNLGLNGLLVLENQPERVFFVTADKSTPEQVRPFHLTTPVEGGQSSGPVILHVKKPHLQASERGRWFPCRKRREPRRRISAHGHRSAIAGPLQDRLADGRHARSNPGHVLREPRRGRPTLPRPPSLAQEHRNRDPRRRQRMPTPHSRTVSATYMPSGRSVMFRSVK